MIRLREGVREGSGFWFWECPICDCAFGPLFRSKEEAAHQGSDHDAEEHPDEVPQ